MVVVGLSFKINAPALASAARLLRSRRQCSPSGRLTPENTSGVFVPLSGRGGGIFNAAVSPRPAAQIRSHAGCALAGDPLALCANEGLQTDWRIFARGYGCLHTKPHPQPPQAVRKTVAHPGTD